MQQLFLTGPHAGRLAEQLFRAFNILPTGMSMVPFAINGHTRGDALHLLLPPIPPLVNDLPCRVHLGQGRTVIVPQVLEDTAAPALLSALTVHSPMLLSGLSGDLLSCPAFYGAVRTCLRSHRPVIVAADESARPKLTRMMEPGDELWLEVPEDEADRYALLERLVEEAALRF